MNQSGIGKKIIRKSLRASFVISTPSLRAKSMYDLMRIKMRHLRRLGKWIAYRNFRDTPPFSKFWAATEKLLVEDTDNTSRPRNSKQKKKPSSSLASVMKKMRKWTQQSNNQGNR